MIKNQKISNVDIGLWNGRKRKMENQTLIKAEKKNRTIEEKSISPPKKIQKLKKITSGKKPRKPKDLKFRNNQNTSIKNENNSLISPYKYFNVNLKQDKEVDLFLEECEKDDELRKLIMDVKIDFFLKDILLNIENNL